MSTEPKLKYSVGILGFGALGQHLYDSIVQDPQISRYAPLPRPTYGMAL